MQRAGHSQNNVFAGDPFHVRFGPEDQEMIEQLDRIYAQLERLGRDEVIRRLQPALTPDEIQRRLADIGLVAPQDVIELYSWHNGTRVEPGTYLDSVHFFPGFSFLSLDDAVRHYVAFRDDERWDRGWLPIFANGGGDFYAVVACSPFPVVGFLIDQREHPVEYESLDAMVSTLSESFDQGAFFVDQRGYLESDDRRHAEIARRNNPSVALWSEARG